MLAVGQASILAALVLGPFDVQIEGQWVLLILAFLDALAGVVYGLLASAVARSDFQAVQFMPVVIAPQVFRCGRLCQPNRCPTCWPSSGIGRP